MLAAALSAILLTAGATGVDAYQLPRGILRTLKPHTTHDEPSPSRASLRAANHAKVKREMSASSGVPGIDSLANWTGQFTTPGFDAAGNPQTVWPFAMVGHSPERGGTTFINAPVVPVTVNLLDAKGNVAVTSSGAKLTLDPKPIVEPTLQSPVFEFFRYSSGFTQFTDALARSEFWNMFHWGDGDWDDSNGWHTLLRPHVQPTREMNLPYGSYYFALNDDGTCCAFVLADENTFATALFPAAPGDSSSVMGAAEKAGDINTRDLSTFLFNNVYLYNGDLSNCCVLGFHSYDLEPGDASNGSRDRVFVMDYASWITPGLFGGGFEDVTAFSHEMAETFNDPFINNDTPWWLAVDPYTGAGLCQNNLETGDVIEVMSSNPVFPVSMHGRTYHPQNEAQFSWFAFQSPSTAKNHGYSFPDETTLPMLSPANLQVNCAQ